MEDRKRFFDSLAARHPPGSILGAGAQKQEDRQKVAARSRSSVETRTQPKHQFVDSLKRLSVFRALPSTFGMPTLDENSPVRVVDPAEVERNIRQPEPPQRSQSVRERSIDSKYEPDFNIMSESVVSLDETNFDDFTEGKEKALIMFYKDFQCPMADLEANFADVAESSRNVKHGFGAVDCVLNRALCAREKICCTPELKLYSNGFEVGHIMKAQKATSAQMSLMVAMTPVLKQPKIVIKGSGQTCQTAKRASTMW